jgi:hypothetical protein
MGQELYLPTCSGIFGHIKSADQCNSFLECRFCLRPVRWKMPSRTESLFHYCLDKISKILIFLAESSHFSLSIYLSSGTLATKNSSMSKYPSWFLLCFCYWPWDSISLWTWSPLWPLGTSFTPLFTPKRNLSMHFCWTQNKNLQLGSGKMKMNHHLKIRTEALIIF